MSTLTFYTNPMSRGRIVRWMLEEIGVPYGTHIVQYATTMKAPEYLAINPMGKVPAITHHGQTITETAAICAYLADAFPQANLAPPPTDPRRAPYYRWLFFAAGPMEAAITNKSLKFEIPEDRTAMAGYGSFDLVMNTLQTFLEGRQTIDNTAFTAADLYLTAQLTFGMMFGSIDKHPAFQAYANRHNQRPAALRAQQIDGDLSGN